MFGHMLLQYLLYQDIIKTNFDWKVNITSKLGCEPDNLELNGLIFTFNGETLGLCISLPLS